MSAKKDFDQVLKKAERQGFRIERTGKGGKVKIYCPDGGIVFASATPSDRRAVRNLVSDLRKHGYA